MKLNIDTFPYVLVWSSYKDAKERKRFLALHQAIIIPALCELLLNAKKFEHKNCLLFNFTIGSTGAAANQFGARFSQDLPGRPDKYHAQLQVRQWTGWMANFYRRRRGKFLGVARRRRVPRATMPGCLHCRRKSLEEP